ncbi:MAG: hypothetical protein E7275_00405 [Pseudobutyrivibrio sp.]|uniref:hypothetical protein n=1 Tax=Pseudobutyrivibrio sp. TaxID=2014367 RepID=UPI0025E26454|nr:hypothetical protein [Pseudobutyrivibrio sp.]MBE5902720.1 hypothetical protein [Pseudobutyrivibrio sp.]
MENKSKPNIQDSSILSPEEQKLLNETQNLVNNSSYNIPSSSSYYPYNNKYEIGSNNNRFSINSIDSSGSGMSISNDVSIDRGAFGHDVGYQSDDSSALSYNSYSSSSSIDISENGYNTEESTVQQNYDSSDISSTLTHDSYISESDDSLSYYNNTFTKEIEANLYVDGYTTDTSLRQSASSSDIDYSDISSNRSFSSYTSSNSDISSDRGYGSISSAQSYNSYTSRPSSVSSDPSISSIGSNVFGASSSNSNNQGDVPPTRGVNRQENFNSLVGASSAGSSVINASDINSQINLSFSASTSSISSTSSDPSIGTYATNSNTQSTKSRPIKRNNAIKKTESPRQFKGAKPK